MIELTHDEAKLLQWISDNRITQAEWRRDGKAAFGPPDRWNQHRLSSADSSITVSADVQKACWKFTEVGPIGGSMWLLNKAGQSALKRYRRAS